MPNLYAMETADSNIILNLEDASLQKAEKALIRKVLEQTGWNLKRTAMLLDIARGTLYSKMEKHNITKPVILNK